MAKRKKSDKPNLADQADKYDCYQQSVQEPEHEIDFFDQAFNDAFNRKPRTLREDFCGTFAVCCEFVKSKKYRHALGVDLDPEPLDWGRANNLSKLSDAQQKRVHLKQQDVRTDDGSGVDILAAQNFSFWIFKTRQEVIDYFKIAYANLGQEGLLVMDMMGGGECYEEGLKDKRVIKEGKKGFNYIWEQDSFNPVNHDATFHISFHFADKSKLKRCFTYDWRFWTIAEVREMLAEAGFASSKVYWEVCTDDGEETGDWEAVESAPSDPSWVCYVVGIKQ